MQTEIMKALAMLYLPALLATIILCLDDIFDGHINICKIYNTFGTVLFGSLFTFMTNSEFVRNNIFIKSNEIKIVRFLLINITIWALLISIKTLIIKKSKKQCDKKRTTEIPM